MRGCSGVFGLVWKSKKKPDASERTSSGLEVDGRPRVGGGEGMSNDRSVTAVIGGVPGNIGSCHSKCGVERPWNIVDSRETILPRGRENLAYVYDGPDSARKPSDVSERVSSNDVFGCGYSDTSR